MGLARLMFHLVLFSSTCAPLLAANDPLADKGTLDLRHWPFAEQGAITLRGEWNFSWQHLFQPNDLTLPQTAPEEFRFVPGFWTQPDPQGKFFPAYGYASYHLRVLVPAAQEKWALDVSPFFTAGELYINGKKLWSSGKVTQNRQGFAHSMEPTIVFFESDQSAIDININIANYVHPKSGFGRILFGPAKVVAIEKETRTATYTFVMGMIAIMCAYHIGLYLLRRGDRSPLYFSMSCMANGVWTLIATGFIYNLFPNIDSELYWKIFYASWFMGYPAFAIFVKSLFPKEFSSRFVQFCFALSGLGTVWLAFTTFEYNEKAAIVFQVFGLFHFAYMFYAIWRAHRAGRSHARLLMVGMTIYFCAICHDVLASEGLLDHQMISPFGLGIYFGFQSYLLAARFSKAFVDLGVKEAEITELNAGLEQKVEEKTRDIRSILQSIQQGIFMIRRVDQTQLAIHSDYSRYLETMVERGDLSGRDPMDLIFQHADVTAEQKSMTHSILDSSVGEPAIAFEMNSTHLPTEIVYSRPHNQKATWELDWTPIVAKDDSIEKMLVSMRDVTTVRKLQTEALEQQKDLEYISEIVNVTAEQFEKFIIMSRSFLEENRRLIEANQQADKEVVKILFINMHTIKGNARGYKFRKMTGLIHDVEHVYANLLNQSESHWNQTELLRDIKKVEDIINKYHSINSVKLGRASRENEVILERQVVADQINSLSLLDLSGLSHKDKAIIEMTKATFSKVFYSQSIDVFESILSESERLARDLKKDTPTVVIDDPGFGLSLEAQDVLRNIFTHIVRNSLDHGIETAQERIEKGKKPSGKLHLKLDERDHMMVITYRDDGRGLNLHQLRQAGIKRGILESSRLYTAQTIADLIFVAGLSTSSQLSDISGRGIGMDAVQRYIRNVGGDIHLCLIDPSQEQGVYTDFYLEMKFPGHFYSRLELLLSKPEPASA